MPNIKFEHSAAIRTNYKLESRPHGQQIVAETGRATSRQLDPGDFILSPSTSSASVGEIIRDYVVHTGVEVDGDNRQIVAYTGDNKVSAVRRHFVVSVDELHTSFSALGFA